MFTFNTMLVILLIGGWLSGKAAGKIKLPAVLGMTIFGLILSISAGERVPPLLWDLAPFLKSLALVVILLRAGLGIRRETLKKVGKTALLMAFLPCLFEGAGLTLLFGLFSPLSWFSSALCGTILAAVSPAVVVPSMLDLKERGYGRDKDVPTMILAGASLDDVLVLTVFSFLMTRAAGETLSPIWAAASLPLAVIGGIIPGIAAGFLLSWFFSKHKDAVRATEKNLILLSLSLLLLEVGNLTHTAALLGVMTLGFVLLERAPEAADELALKLNRAWIPAQIFLFVLIGMAVDPKTASSVGPEGIAIIIGGLVFRSLGVFLATIKADLTMKERLFSMAAYTPKATVQAAIGSVPLAAGIPGGEYILAMAVTAILLTAPLGLILIRILGPRCLASPPLPDQNPDFLA